MSERSRGKGGVGAESSRPIPGRDEQTQPSPSPQTFWGGVWKVKLPKKEWLLLVGMAFLVQFWVLGFTTRNIEGPLPLHVAVPIMATAWVAMAVFTLLMVYARFVEMGGW